MGAEFEALYGVFEELAEMIAEGEWYKGNAARFRSIPWLHEMERAPQMPWKVEYVHPLGYVVMISSGVSMFKILNKPVIVEGDVIA